MTPDIQTRCNNACLLSRSTRTLLPCFDDLELCRFGDNASYLINYVSNGDNTNPSSLSRPVSILWPDTYERLTEQVATLDAHLLSVNFKDKPVAWMLDNNLTIVPQCKHCNQKMNLIYENNTVRWQCLRTQSCSHYFMPIQRPSFFHSYEKVSLDKLLFSIYYWSTATPTDELYSMMNIKPVVLDSIWRRLQNVCRNLLEKKYPRLRLTDSLSDNTNTSNNPTEPVDLISIKLNELFVICAKHPKSNLVRLGLLIPGVSKYSFVNLTESWFAHGTSVRIAERKFLDLKRERSDLKVNLVSRTAIMSKDGRFDRNSAFGYIICQLSHVLKDFNSSTLSCETLKLILAEMEWREIYGPTPYDTFSNIVAHIVEFGETSDWYTEPSLPTPEEQTVDKELSTNTIAFSNVSASEQVWAEKYYYANIDPVDSDGKVICNFLEPLTQYQLARPVAMIRCHECNQTFESFDFSFHIASHVELNRHEHERQEYKKRSLVECKHCFKTFSREHLLMHKTLVRSHLHMVKYGCRICCVLLDGRAEYLQHMRILHFKHERPYRCPSCDFASSFQRDVYIHFQEEHRYSMIVLCPICLRSFTVRKPENMTTRDMAELSKIIYNHIAEHYVISKSFTCSNCCLCFLNKKQLRRHKILHHDPYEKRPANVRLSEFVVTKEEEEHCVKALYKELFIVNNALNDKSRLMKEYKRKVLEKKKMMKQKNKRVTCDDELTHSDSEEANHSDSSSISLTDENESSSEASKSDKNEKLSKVNQNNNHVGGLGDLKENEKVDLEEEDSSDDSFSSDSGEETMFVRGGLEAKKFYKDEHGDLKVTSYKFYSKKSLPPSISSSELNNNVSAAMTDTCSSDKLVEYLSRMKQADGILPNQSAIITPRGGPAKCCECSQFITKDHFVAVINCKDCKYTTNCPRAIIAHKKTRHDTSAH